MNRFLTFHTHGTSNNEVQMSPAYYLDGDYAPIAVRIYAEDAPTRNAKVDIYDDGVSIFNNNVADSKSTTGVVTVPDAETDAVLASGENSDELSDDFNDTPMAKESWITCKLVDAGSGGNFTVQLEIELISDEDE